MHGKGWGPKQGHPKESGTQLTPEASQELSWKRQPPGRFRNPGLYLASMGILLCNFEYILAPSGLQPSHLESRGLGLSVF